MFSRRTDPNIPTETVKGPSLARGPAWIVGLVLSVFGMIMFFNAPGTPLSTAEFPDGVATGDTWLGFEMNAWTAWLTTAAGLLVLMGAAQHLAARTFSLVAGLALGAMSVIALIDGDDVLGLAAANGLDALGWGIASAVLLVTALLPRIRREREIATTDQDRVAERDRARIAQRETAGGPAVANRAGEPIAEHDRHRVADRDVAGHDHVTDRERIVGRERESIGSDDPATQTYAERQRAAGEPAGPGGMRSEPMRRTYEGQPQPTQTEADREAQAQAAEGQTRSR